MLLRILGGDAVLLRTQSITRAADDAKDQEMGKFPSEK